jgi:hypothetical protein
VCYFLKLGWKGLFKVANSVSREEGTEVATIHQIEVLSVATSDQVIYERVIVYVTATTDAEQLGFDLSVNARSDVHTAPVIEDRSIVVSLQDREELGEFRIETDASLKEGRGYRLERGGVLPHRDIKATRWAVISVLLMQEETVGEGEKDIVPHLSICREDANCFGECVFECSGKAGYSKVRIRSAPRSPRSNLKE